MNCKESENLINELVDGSIGASEKGLLEKHLSGCGGCRDALMQTRMLLEKLSALPKEIEPDSELKEKLWGKIEQEMSLFHPDLIAGSLDLRHRSNGKTTSPRLGPESEINSPGVKGAVRRRRWGWYMSGIAAMLLVGFGLYFLYQIFAVESEGSGIIAQAPVYWKINKTQGSPSLRDENSGLRNINDIDSFTTGEWILTDNSSSAEITAAGVGSIRVEPGTKVKFLSSSRDSHRIMLEQGTIEASITAKPGTFFVETVSATAIDLGCSYTLTVEESGDGILYVKDGLVALRANGRESLVPAGKFCITKQGIGPGTPYGAGSSPSLKNALLKFDFEKGGDESINVILKHAKKSDAVTLLNIMQRVDDTNRVRVYKQLKKFVPPPKPYPPDSIPFFKPGEITEWIEIMQDEIRENLQKNMEDLKEQLDDMKMNMKFEFDGRKFGKEFKFNRENLPHDSSKYDYNYNYDFDYDTLAFNKEEFQKELNEEMEKVSKELEEVNKELELNKEEIKKEMERVKEELKDIDIEIKVEMKKAQEEIKKEIEEEMNKEKEKIKEEKEKQKEKAEEDKNK